MSMTTYLQKRTYYKILQNVQMDQD